MYDVKFLCGHVKACVKDIKASWCLCGECMDKKRNAFIEEHGLDYVQGNIRVPSTMGAIGLPKKWYESYHFEYRDDLDRWDVSVHSSDGRFEGYGKSMPFKGLEPLPVEVEPLKVTKSSEAAVVDNYGNVIDEAGGYLL